MLTYEQIILSLLIRRLVSCSLLDERWAWSHWLNSDVILCRELAAPERPSSAHVSLPYLRVGVWWTPLGRLPGNHIPPPAQGSTQWGQRWCWGTVPVSFCWGVTLFWAQDTFPRAREEGAVGGWGRRNKCPPFLNAKKKKKTFQIPKLGLIFTWFIDCFSFSFFLAWIS